MADRVYQAHPSSVNDEVQGKSRTPCIVLPIVGLFVLMLCYLTIVVVRNISPTAIRQTEGRRATATALTIREANAGATIAVELQAEATETAIAAPSPTPAHDDETPTILPRPTPTVTVGTTGPPP